MATNRDDSSVLITLTAREHNPRATIIAAVREEENRHLRHQSGADSVITSSSAGGRLLGTAAVSPQVVEVLEGLLTVDSGLDVVEREVASDQVGAALRDLPAGEPVVAVVREGRLLRFDDAALAEPRAGGRLVSLRSMPEPHPQPSGA